MKSINRVLILLFILGHNLTSYEGRETIIALAFKMREFNYG
jgi:hypothetical protein